METKTKTCTCCNKELPITKFGVTRKNKDGLNYWCKDCINAGNQKRTKKDSNPDLVSFTPRQLIEELKIRGYKGTLTFEQRIIL